MSSIPIHPADLILIFVYLLATVAFGSWIGRKNESADDFMLGSRNLPWWTILFSVVATETSSVTFLSIPGQSYGGNLSLLQLAVGFVIGRYLVGWILLPLYFEGKIYTSYQVLSKRFGPATKSCASILFLITRTLADGLRLYLTAIVLKHAVGLDLLPAVLAIGVATVIYTIVGGIRAVVWTDCIQLFVYSIGAVIAGLVMLSSIDGGAAGVLEFAETNIDWKGISFGPSLSAGNSLWAGLIGGTIIALGSHGVDQLTVQRLLCARSQKDAARALQWSGWVVLVQFTLFLAIGVGLAAFYQSKEFDNSDEIFADFIVHHLPVGVVGLTLAALFSAAMSTLSSSLNSSATVAVNDIYLPLTRRLMSDEKHTVLVTRLMTGLFGVAQMAIAVSGENFESSVVVSVLAIAGLTTGVVLGVFLLGVWTKVGQVGAIVGMVCGLAISLTLRQWGDMTWQWLGPIATVSSFGIGYFVDLYRDSNEY